MKIVSNTWYEGVYIRLTLRCHNHDMAPAKIQIIITEV